MAFSCASTSSTAALQQQRHPPTSPINTSNSTAPAQARKKTESLSLSAAAQNSITEEKYKQLKRKLKAMMEENESISREYSQAKRKVRLLMMERNVLLDNIAQMGTVEVDTSSSDEYDDNDDDDILLPTHSPMSLTRRIRRKASVDGEIYHPHVQQLTADQQQRHFHQHKRGYSKTRTITKTLSRLQQSSVAQEQEQQAYPDLHRRRRDNSNASSSQDNNNDDASPSTMSSTVSASAPPKRSKMSRAVTKTRRVQPVDRDENGNVKLPQQIGVLTVVKLGKIVHDRDAFHNERYIFPVGFTVERTYPSMINPHSNTSIVSTILDGGDGPRFHIVAADMPDQPIIANSATGAWTVVVRRSNEIRHREHSNSASGPDYYGFKHPTIAKMIQDLPNADKLRYYVRQNFEEMEPRAAKGVMAAAQKKRGNLEQMGNANVRPGATIPKQYNRSSTTIIAATATTTPLPSPPHQHHHDDDDDDNGPSGGVTMTDFIATGAAVATAASGTDADADLHYRHHRQQQPYFHQTEGAQGRQQQSSPPSSSSSSSHQRPYSISNHPHDPYDDENEFDVSPPPSLPPPSYHHHHHRHDQQYRRSTNPHSISSLLQPASPSPVKVYYDDDEVDQLHSDNDGL